MIERKFSQKVIAETIGKCKSVVSREIRRNRDQRSNKYNSDLAQRKYQKRMKGKPKKQQFMDCVKKLTDNLLNQDYSPE